MIFFSSPRHHLCVSIRMQPMAVTVSNHLAIVCCMCIIHFWHMQWNVIADTGRMSNGTEEIMPLLLSPMKIIIVIVAMAAASSCYRHLLKSYTLFAIVLMTCAILNCCSPFMRSSYHQSTNQHVAASTTAFIFTLTIA